MLLSSIGRRIGLCMMAASSLMPAQTRANLNGTWKMDPGKSDFGSGPVSITRLDKIALDGSHLKDTITQQLRRGPQTTYDMIYTTDGKESTNHVRGNLVKSTAQWEGDELVIESKVYALREGAMQDRWSVSADGKTLTLVRHMTGAIEAEQKVVFERQ